MTFLVPQILQTDRLILRRIRKEDWSDLHAYYLGQAATRYTFGRPLSEGDTWRFMCGMTVHWQVRGYVPYAVEEKLAKSCWERSVSGSLSTGPRRK